MPDGIEERKAYAGASRKIPRRHADFRGQKREGALLFLRFSGAGTLFAE